MAESATDRLRKAAQRLHDSRRTVTEAARSMADDQAATDALRLPPPEIPQSGGA
jgi:hypothetical protein